MLLKAITITNFKGIGEPVRVELKPITLLFGPNSAGKSTIIQALHYAREIFERHNFDPDRTLDGGVYVDLGGFKNLVHKFDLKRTIKLRFDFNYSQTDFPEYLTRPERNLRKADPDNQSERDPWDLSARIYSGWIEVSLKWSHALNKVQLTEYETGFNEQPFARILATEDGRRVRLAYLNFAHTSFPVDADEFEGVDDPPRSTFEMMYDIIIDENVAPKGDDLELGLVGLKSALPRCGRPLQLLESCLSEDFISEDGHERVFDEFTANLSQLLVGPVEVLRDFLREFRYLGPLRETPPRDYKPLNFLEPGRWAGGLAAWDLLCKKDEGFFAKVNEWFASPERLNSGYALKLKKFKLIDVDEPYYRELESGEFLNDNKDQIGELISQPEQKRLVLIDQKRGIEVQSQDIGVGISQVLPVVVGALEPSFQIFAVEQPELHIHPALQVALGDIFINAIQEHQCLFLIETHSEHLLLRLLRRIRETTDGELPEGMAPLTRRELSVNYVFTPEDQVQVQQMDVSDDGDADGEWPAGFFAERARELF